MSESSPDDHRAICPLFWTCYTLTIQVRLAGSPHAGGRMALPILTAIPGGFGWRILGEPPALGVADLVESVVQAVVR